MSSVAGKRVWITGGGSGVGAGSALLLAERGAEVIVSGRRVDKLEEVVAQITTKGGKASAVAVDMGDATAVEQAAAKIGQVDILLASAGLNVPNRSLDKLGTADWDTVVNVNLNGVYYPIHAVLPQMRARRDGLVMIVSSWAGRHVGRLTGAAYTATKHAVVALSETINCEEGSNGIRSTVIMPGEIATDILKARPTPPSQADMDRMLQVDDLAETVRYVAEMPAHVCVNEILLSPTWNRFYQGFAEV
ncbi:SDR family oxidoreductase [Roseobacter sp. N2S]|uniref:SDR family oxidoreductase n=1 Tax=Roseobacter sp. N2S TaxID=2663844 RepID=UPI0028562CA1|nr:SDR family oxidoreductase [Roseobacter sp. N2S]MDR6264041.1 NADP-dependent 3-hydroxy acid dehydrogenase YdfG [Roseobacter sp. N2S]